MLASHRKQNRLNPLYRSHTRSKDLLCSNHYCSSRSHLDTICRKDSCLHKMNNLEGTRFCKKMIHTRLCKQRSFQCILKSILHTSRYHCRYFFYDSDLITYGHSPSRIKFPVDSDRKIQKISNMINFEQKFLTFLYVLVYQNRRTRLFNFNQNLTAVITDNRRRHLFTIKNLLYLFAKCRLLNLGHELHLTKFLPFSFMISSYN